MSYKIAIKDFSFYYDSAQALKNINLHIEPREIFAIFGPARSGKTTLLKSLNRLTDLTFGTRHTGTIYLDGSDIYDPGISLIQLRRRVGMVFDLPIALPMSIFANVAYGPKLSGISQKKKPERDRREVSESGCTLGRGERPSPHLCAAAFRRTAATPLYCSKFGLRTGSTHA